MTAHPPASDPQLELRSILLVQDAASMAGSLGKLLFGAGWCLAVGFVVATLVTGILYSFFGSSWLGWSGWFAIYLLVLVPLLIWTERRSREDDLVNAPSGVDTASSNRGEYQINNGGVLPGVWSSKLVWGPRAMIDGFRGVRGRRTVRQTALFDRAVVLIFDLAKVDGRVPVQSLIHPPEDMQTFGSAVDWLERHDWIGKATEGDSFWLSTLGRKKLLEHRLNPLQSRPKV